MLISIVLDDLILDVTAVICRRLAVYLKLASAITLVLQVNQVNKSASHPKCTILFKTICRKNVVADIFIKL